MLSLDLLFLIQGDAIIELVTKSLLLEQIYLINWKIENRKARFIQNLALSMRKTKNH